MKFLKYMILAAVVLGSIMTFGCVANNKQQVVLAPPAPVDNCPLPSGFQLEPAIEQAERTLTLCPDKLDAVFMELIEIAKDKPQAANKKAIRGMLMRLVEQGAISEKYAKNNLYNRYFSSSFTYDLKNIKFKYVGSKINEIKKGMADELAAKRIGLLQACDDLKSYKKAESTYARFIRFIDSAAYINGGYQSGS